MSTLQVVIPLFPQFTALDGIGPYEVLQRIPSIDVTFISHQRGEVRSENGFLGITADGTFDDFPAPDVIVFPGGVGTRPLVHDARVTDWVRTAHATTKYTTSVCTGAIVLGAAGLLNGLTATTHWACYPELEAQGATAVADRVVEHLDRRVITAAEAAQLMIEYDPKPPFTCGSVASTNAAPDGAAVMHRVIEYAQLRQ